MSEQVAAGILLFVWGLSIGLLAMDWKNKRYDRTLSERAIKAEGEAWYWRSRLIAEVAPQHWCDVCAFTPVVCGPGGLEDCRGPEFREADHE